MTSVLVTGVTGQLGNAFRARLGSGATYIDRSDMDLTDVASIRPILEEHGPDIVINCAAFTAVDAAESREEEAHTVNAIAVGELASACRDLGARFVTFSTDYVFDGSKSGPYVESDPVAPINAYGRTKEAGERLAIAALPSTLVIRTSWVMSATHRCFASVILERLLEGEVSVIDDQHGCPTFVDDLAAASLAAIDAGAEGLLHLTNSGDTTWFGIARTIAEKAGVDPDRVSPCRTEDYPTAADRPRNSVLASERLGGLGLSPLRDFREPLVETVDLLIRNGGPSG